MPESENKCAFKLSEVADSLVRDRGIKKGYWRLYFGFALIAANIEKPDKTGQAPAAIVPITEMGLLQVDAEKEDDLTVNAAETWKRFKAKA